MERARRARQPRTGAVATAALGAGTPPAWVNLGPTRADFEINGHVLPGVDSGRASSIVVHPTDLNTIYVATAGGGVWKSSNGGLTWIPITDSLGSLFTGALEMDPQSPDTLYLGLGDFANSDGGTLGAFFKSTDGGGSWSAATVLQHATTSGGATSVSTATYIKQLLTSPAVPGLILAATDVGLFRSADAGTTWSYVDLGAAAGPSPVIWSLAWTGGNGFALSLVPAGAANGGGMVLVSADAGATWTAAAGPSSPLGVARMTLAAAPSNRALLYALAADGSTVGLADIFRSFDGGRSWAPLNAAQAPLTNPNPTTSSLSTLFTGQAWYDQLVLVSPTNPEIAYFGGSVVFAQTTDGGATYSLLTDSLAQNGLPYVHADYQCGTFDSSGTLYAGTDGGIFKSTDGGHAWISSLNVGIISHLTYSVGSSLANRAMVIGGFQDDGTRVRSGATSTFNQLIGGDGFGSHAHATNPSLMLGSLYFSQIYRSVDGGNSFAPASRGIAGIDPGTSQFFTKIVPGTGDASGNTVYTLGDLAAYRSTDYAGTWTPLDATGLPTYGLRNIGASRSNPLVLGLVAEPGTVYLSSDGGASWAQAAPLPNSRGALSSIWFDTSNPQTIYVSSVARIVGASHLWKSTDGGLSWTVIGTSAGGVPPNRLPVNVIVNDPTNPQRLYAGTVLGLYQSDDGGATWSAGCCAGLPLVDVADIYVAPDASLVRVATYGRGFWELTTATPFQGITLTPASAPDGTLGSAYPPTSFFATGGTGPWTFSVTAGVLPGGLSLGSTGVLSGTPNTAGTFTFRVTATDSTPATAGGPFSGSQTYLVTITPRLPTITIAPAALPAGSVNSMYPTTNLSASGGTAPYRYSIGSGTLPAGLTLSTSGVLAGTPSTPGNYAFAVTATDSTPATAGGPFSGTQPYSVVIARAAQVITFGPLMDLALGSPDFTLNATATSGGAVAYSSLTPATCTVAGSTVHLVAVGTCTIAADQPGSLIYGPAPEVTQSFVVLPAVPDTTPPTVVGLTCAEPSPTMADALTCTLAFSESVTGVSASNVVITPTGPIGAAVSAVSGAGPTWSVTVGTGRGSGQLQLGFAGGAEITDLAGNALVATTVAGPQYVVDKGGTVTGTGFGRPDPAFASQGYALFSDVPVAASPGVAVLPDGRILAAGTVACDAVTGLCALQFARYLATGAADASFGSSGRLVTAVTGVEYVLPPVAQPDGRLVVSGVLSADGGVTAAPFVARFNADGSPDASWGTQGVVLATAMPAGSALSGAAVDGVGRVLLVGTTAFVRSTGTDIVVARLTAAGQADAGFGAGGLVQLGVSTTGNRNDAGIGVVAAPDGTIVVSGRTVGPTGSNDFLLLRLSAAGALDPTFGTNGITTTRVVSSGSNSGSRMLRQPDGSLLQIGSLAGTQCGVVRYTAAGVVDAAFGASGAVVLPAFHTCYDVALYPDGRVLLVGANFTASVIDAEFARLLPTGAPDPAFGTGGVLAITDYDGAGWVALTATGNVVTGLTTEDPADGVIKSYVVQLAAQPAPTLTTLSASPPSASYGQPITLTAAVSYTGAVAPSGSVAFQDGGAFVGASVAVAPCVPAAAAAICASVTIAAAATGVHGFTAAYGGDANFAASTSPTASLTIVAAPTTVSLAAAPNPSTAGQAVTFTALVSPLAGPTGTVAFLDGASALGSAPLVDGAAALTTSALTVGTHAVTAAYAGDANYAPAASTAVPQVVNPVVPVASTTILTSSANPAIVGQSVTYTATVSGAGGTPAGTVAFKQGSTSLGTVALAGGQASLTTSYTTTGTRAISAAYGGSAQFLPSTSATLSEVIRTKLPTTTTLTSSSNPAFVGQSVTFTATVTASGTTIPDGTAVAFSNGGSALGTATTLGGQAILTTSSLAVGTRAIRASFAGTALLAASTSAVLSQAVTKYPTTTTVSATPSPSVYRQAVTLVATIGTAGPPPTGTVTFRNGTTSLGQATVSAGTATLIVTALPAGAATITASYGGDPSSAPSVSAPLAQTVDPAPTALRLTSSPNPSIAGRSVTLTATVTTPVGVASGVVSFSAGSTLIGTASLNSSGVARLSTAALPKGLTTVTASYAGSSAFQPSSASIVQTVN